ncbi:hypothetical protein Tco_0496186 [Tanacetum coccineum]
MSLQFQMEECHLLLTDKIDWVNPEGNQVKHDISKPLPLGGPLSQVTIQTQYFFNKDLEYLVSGDKERMNTLLISKMIAAYYPNFKLEELVPLLWIKSKRAYDICAAYGITHWWFKHKEFYVTRHSALSNHSAVSSYMQILSVVSLKTYSRYRYTFLKEIVLRRADNMKHKILEADFKNLHPNDFEDMYLLHLQGKLNHLSGADKVHLFNAVNLWIRNIIIRQRVEDLQLGIESYQTKLNLTKPNWDASDFLFKEDYTIVNKTRAVIYRDRNNQKKMMRKTEVHKFSDEHPSDTLVFTMKMEILLEPTSNNLMVEPRRNSWLCLLIGWCSWLEMFCGKIQESCVDLCFDLKKVVLSCLEQALVAYLEVLQLISSTYGSDLSQVLRDLPLHRSSIYNSARISNKFGGCYFFFKFGISGLLHQVITTIADRIRDNELLEYMDVHDNDASESSQPSWGKMCTSGTLLTLMLPGQLPGGSSVFYFT